VIESVVSLSLRKQSHNGKDEVILKRNI